MISAVSSPLLFDPCIFDFSCRILSPLSKARAVVFLSGLLRKRADRIQSYNFFAYTPLGYPMERSLAYLCRILA